ncbi:hypothetical protein AAFF_G00264830 [Aldrovandia affinis]|uniref:ADAM metallopeptidase domain 11 n=1 Tax=Aldrovandia affinis TaxID=143900 RepID=A0AAD7W2H3_9TELE|nr:hypothetical protein AAFF_G00264830 [Aldrovandia affinis]
MLAVRCLLIAAVSARFAVAGWRRSGMRDREEGHGAAAEAVTRPTRLVRQMDSEEEVTHARLDTRVKGAPSVHLAQSSFQLEAFGKTFILDLELNHHLLSKDYVERNFNSDGKPSQSTGGEHCYYQGLVRGVPGSWAALSTCHGLRGMFSDGRFCYGIEPALGEGDQARWPQRTVQSETKYIELMVVNDHDLFLQLRSSTSQTRNFAKAVVNMADAIFKEQLNTRLVLVALETWSSANMISVGDDPLLTLRDFLKYRKESIREPSDTVHLLSALPLSGRLAGLPDGGHRVLHPRKFSRCSVEEYARFLQRGGGSCLFNKPNKYEQRAVVCREAVNSCDVPETCTGDSSQCPHNVHKLDGYMCDNSQGRCYGGRCRTRDGQCRGLWGHDSADRFCYEKLNSEGSEKGNCGRDSSGQGWLQCNKQDVLCGLLMCTNVTAQPAVGELHGEMTSLTIYHQNKYLDCRGGHAVLEDGSDLGYVEDGTPCGPNMMCLGHRCLPLATFNLSACPGSPASQTCSDHGTCSNEVKCICDRDYTGKDCSFYDPIPEPKPREGPEKKGSYLASCWPITGARARTSPSCWPITRTHLPPPPPHLIVLFPPSLPLLTSCLTPHPITLFPRQLYIKPIKVHALS